MSQQGERMVCLFVGGRAEMEDGVLDRQYKDVRCGRTDGSTVMDALRILCGRNDGGYCSARTCTTPLRRVTVILCTRVQMRKKARNTVMWRHTSCHANNHSSTCPCLRSIAARDHYISHRSGGTLIGSRLPRSSNPHLAATRKNKAPSNHHLSAAIAEIHLGGNTRAGRQSDGTRRLRVGKPEDSSQWSSLCYTYLLARRIEESIQAWLLVCARTANLLLRPRCEYTTSETRFTSARGGSCMTHPCQYVPIVSPEIQYKSVLGIDASMTRRSNVEPYSWMGSITSMHT
ncbi:hypothetical protein EI94DRAFT_197405 [Lactarius quietus]|nr:hypothetical protein EI94DRAFT_197405 [Lactarius quietus]